MASPRSRRFLVTQVQAGGQRRFPDDLVVEEPMTIVVDGTTVTTTMRTPGNDFELAAGFCHTEGIIGAAPRSMRYCGANTSASDTDFNRVEVLSPGPPVVLPERRVVATSSCGWCGSEQIDALIERIAPLPMSPMIPPEVISETIGSIRAQQTIFDLTGASHAAASFGMDGAIGDVREDVGRHNAVDKVVGAMLLRGDLPATGHGLFVSGRASTELVQKACAAGFSTLVAVSAPTALAVEAARRAGLYLIGFARDDRMTIYAPERVPPERVAPESTS